jgi:hypothetical protein
MIKLQYKPWEQERSWGYAEDVPPVEELTMTLGDGVTWQEATDEFHNFLRAAGYVIPYDFEDEEEEQDNWREGWIPLTYSEVQDLEYEHQKYDESNEPWFDRRGFATDIQLRLKELNT